MLYAAFLKKEILLVENKKKRWLQKSCEFEKQVRLLFNLRVEVLCFTSLILKQFWRRGLREELKS